MIIILLLSALHLTGALVAISTVGTGCPLRLTLPHCLTASTPPLWRSHMGKGGWTLLVGSRRCILTEDWTRLNRAKANQIQTVPAHTMKNDCWGSSSPLCQFKVDSIVVPEHQPIKVRYSVLWEQEARIELAVQAKGWKSPWGSFRQWQGGFLNQSFL